MIQTKQVTRGQNIVADGWAEASNLHTHPIPSPKCMLKARRKVKRKRREKKNDAGYTATPVTCGLAGAMFEVTKPLRQ